MDLLRPNGYHLPSFQRSQEGEKGGADYKAQAAEEHSPRPRAAASSVAVVNTFPCHLRLAAISRAPLATMKPSAHFKRDLPQLAYSTTTEYVQGEGIDMPTPPILAPVATFADWNQLQVKHLLRRR